MAPPEERSAKFMTSFDSDIVSGSVVRSVVKLAWPIAITQLIAGIHGIVDQILVGNYVSFSAQAAIGVSWLLFLVIFVFLSSLFHGMNILIARYSGRQDGETVNRIAYVVFITSGYVIPLSIAPLGYFLSPALLDLVNAAPEVQVHALPYIRILFTASLPLFLMFAMNGAFQSSGNPKIPLYLGILTTVVNVIASYVLITGLGPFPELGTAGAAIGTCLGPIPSILIGLILIQKRKVIIGPPERLTIVPDFSVLKAVVRLGLPSGIQAVLLNIGGVALLRYIGSLEESAEAQAAYTICYAQLFAVVTWTGFGLRAACSTVMGQNMGAGKSERGKRAVYVGAGLGLLWAAAFGLLFWTLPNTLLGFFFIEDVLVLDIGANLLHFLTFSGLFVAVALAFTGGLQGAGDTKKPMYIAFVSQIVVLLGVCAVYESMGRLSTNAIWTAILVSHMSRFALSYIVFARGKWEGITVEIDQGA